MIDNPYQPESSTVPAEEFPVWLADTILRRAMDSGATDVHMNPVDGVYRILFRVDGAFRVEGVVDAAQGKAAISRMKVMARLKTYVNSLPQEGRLSLARTPAQSASASSAGTAGPSEARISVFPTVTGEKAVIRLFGTIGEIPLISDLGLPDKAAEFLKSQAMASGGVVAICGPSGSGKTTTLYSVLAHIHATRGEFASIATLEDPVERVTGLFAQTEIGEALPFHRALPGLLRQDPEVIMIGEVRDADTAKIAFEAGLTGHLILTSMHCDDAAGAMLRLKDLGVPDCIVRPAVNGVLALRLLRKVCAACAESVELKSPLLAAWEARGWGEPPRSAARKTGCQKCSMSGYAGLVPVCQAVDARKSSRSGGGFELPVCGPVRIVSDFCESMRTHLEKGVTTIEECFRVFPNEQ